VECVQVDSVGTFTVEETEAPSGYLISDPAQQTITISDSYGCSQTPYLVTFYDQAPTNPPASTCAPTPSPTPYTPTTYTPASTSGGGNCGLQISVSGQSSYAGASQAPLAGATLEVTGADGRAQPISMTSDTVCVNVPVGGYTIRQIAPPQSTTWTPVTSFPIYGECLTQCSCPSYHSTQTILYTSS